MIANQTISTGAVIVAAGTSSRMLGIDKVSVEVAGAPLLLWSVRSADCCRHIERIAVVVHPERYEWARELVEHEPLHKPILVCSGGARRQDSVMAGALALETVSFVAVHDAARPFATPDLWMRTVEAAWSGGTCAIAAIPVRDTLKRSFPAGSPVQTVPRDGVWLAQTPQVCQRARLLEGLRLLEERHIQATDEASVFEYLGDAIFLVTGDTRNFKITTPDDLALAQAWSAAHISSIRSATERLRVGIGYDIHRLTTGRPLILGGERITHDQGLDGHSDADVLLHALMDALLGAAALGDIGVHFPPSDPRYRGADSRSLLRSVVQLVRQNGFVPAQVDAVVIAERPRLREVIDPMRQHIAADLGCTLDMVNIKATTNERLGPEGRQEGISAFVVATVVSVSGIEEKKSDSADL
ncbi:MAG: 2-C-methyl-D-erythritol 4-phosphate cytidylyltransferase [Chloroflexi bacterium]|nr:2-C-methyl-D-erythritol 4-phosphate cytidylyltransferase [Chloroflexota bacterium]